MKRLGAALGILLLSGGCAHRDRLDLLAGENGAESGAVVVLDANGETERAVIDQANTTAKFGSGGGVAARATPGAKLETRHRALLAFMPEPAMPFSLRFAEGSTDLVPASRAELTALFAEVRRRMPGVDVSIVGHTDTLGSEGDNDRLSQRRADEMAEQLIAHGLDRGLISTAGRGERELATPTPDETRSEANRRVQIIVR